MLARAVAADVVSISVTDTDIHADVASSLPAVVEGSGVVSSTLDAVDWRIADELGEDCDGDLLASVDVSASDEGGVDSRGVS